MGLEIFQNFYEIFKYFKVKYFIVHPQPLYIKTWANLPLNLGLSPKFWHGIVYANSVYSSDRKLSPKKNELLFLIITIIVPPFD